jgi:hypothetical protein
MQRTGQMYSAFELLSYAVPHNLLKSLVPVLFQALGMKIQRWRRVCCALTD